MVKSFGSVRSVSGLDLTVPAGSFFGIAGPNGAGKTTFIRMIAGLLRPDAGSPDILPIDDLPSYCSLHQTEIGIICVPPEAAQDAADMLVRSGISAIWCFAPVRLRLPDNVKVQYENLALSLAHLHQKVKSIH